MYYKFRHLTPLLLMLSIACRDTETTGPRPDGALPSQKTLSTASVGVSAFPGVNGKIAFQSASSGNSEIYTMNADGSSQTKITNNPALDGGAVWSPDGLKIAFYSDRGGNNDIYVMMADGSAVVNVTNNPAGDTSPGWSPDGSKIAFISTRDGNQEIYVINSDGSNPTRLTNTTCREYPPSWSPDGTRIAFWSDCVGHFQVFVMNADGTNVVQLSSPLQGPDAFDPAWSPDAAKLAFWAGSGNSHDVWVVNADGTNPVNLTNGVGDNAEPAYSPDGSKIAFVSNRFGNYGICTMNSVGTGVSCLTNGNDGGPDWAPAPPAAPADLKLGFRGPPPSFILNQPATVQFRNSDLGPSASSGAHLFVPSSPAFRFLFATGATCAPATGGLLCTLGAVPVNGKLLFSLTVRPIQVGTFQTTLTLTGNEPDPNPANNVITRSVTVAPSPTQVIDFTSIACTTPEVLSFTSPFTIDGFSFTNGSGLNFASWCSSATHYPASPALFNSGGNTTATLTKAGGGKFQIVSIDLAQLYFLQSNFVSIVFTGTKANGSTTSQTFSFTGNGGSPVLQTFIFNSSFTNLVSLAWDQGGNDLHQFDNVTVR